MIKMEKIVNFDIITLLNSKSYIGWNYCFLKIYNQNFAKYSILSHKHYRNVNEKYFNIYKIN